MSAPHKESWYQAKIIRWLKEQYPGAFVWKAQAGPYVGVIHNAAPPARA